MSLLSVVVFSTNSCRKNEVQLNKLTVHTPFRFSEKINPRKIITIGDQILSEHLFAAHSVRNPNLGLIDVFSTVDINRIDNIIMFSLKNEIILSNGERLSVTDICKSTKLSFLDTSHSQLASLVISVQCSDGNILVKMREIPTNMEALLSIPDFFIYNENQIPVSSENITPTSGPYQLLSISEKQVKLKINKYYPDSLKANNVEYVDINQLESDSLDLFLKTHHDQKHLLAYWGGYFIKDEDIESINNENMVLSIFPSEWVFMIGFNNKTFSLEDRRLLASLINLNKTDILKNSPLAQASNSVSPSDRSFGLLSTDLDYPTRIERPIRLSRELSIGFRLRDKDQILIKNLISQLIKIDNLKIEFFDHPSDIYSKTDAYCGVQGISAGDPVHHMNFFYKYEPLYKEVVSIDELNSISLIDDNQKFVKEIKKIEKRVSSSAVIIPIAHFPGVVLHSNDLKPDEGLVGDWGIRSWTYQVLD